MDKPLTYLDFENRTSTKYFFISYSHKDKEAVYDILYKLYNESVNYWYDTELDVGDEWSEKAEQIINSDDCIGTVFFITEDSLKSEAVFQEVQASNINKKNRDDFNTYVVLLSTATHFDDLVFSIAQNDQQFFKTRSHDFNRLSGDEGGIVFCSVGDAVDRIKRVALKRGAHSSGTIYTRDIKTPLQSIDGYYSEGGNSFIKCGEYPQGINTDPECIVWKLIHRHSDKLYFLSEHALEYCKAQKIPAYINTINELVENKLSEITFEIKLLDVALIKECGSGISPNLITDYADLERSQLLKLFWVEDASLNNEYGLVTSNNHIVTKRINKNSICAGFRPMLIIHAEITGGAESE